MNRLFRVLSYLGTKPDQNPALKRNIIITNRISLIIFLFSCLLAGATFLYYGESSLSILILSASILLLPPLLLNHLERFNLSRFILSCYLPFFSVVISLLDKKTSQLKYLQESSYFNARFFIIASLIVPLITINIRERFLFLSGILAGAVALVFFDPIHNFFGLGYFQNGLHGKDYYFASNLYSVVAYLFILGSFIFLKTVSERMENENEVLIANLNNSNDYLKRQKEEIELQNNEILAQSEELVTNQDQLLEAYSVIERQKNQLELLNSGLQVELIDRNKQLLNANDELIKYNNELRQFSYTVSHNLRGPLARLLGLSHLLEKDRTGLSANQLHLLDLMSNSTRELDDVIKDLNKIIDIRNEIYGLREKVFFKDEWSLIYKTLYPALKDDMMLITDFREAPFVYTVRPILNSILYNLTSNAIKYHSPSRPLRVTIKTRPEEDSVILEVKDNGLGMNLDQVGKNVFGLYKRFHNHTEGKGLGLYLVKSQIEAVGGRVELQSELNVGTVFTIHFKIPREIEGQICFENEAGKVFYNGRLNYAGVIWKKQVTSDEYRALFIKCLEIVRLYHTPSWMSDLRMQGQVTEEDQQWMIHEIMPEAGRNGLQRMAVVYDIEQRDEDYRAKMKEQSTLYNLDMEYFTDIKDAEWWVESFTLMNTQPE